VPGIGSAGPPNRFFRAGGQLHHLHSAERVMIF
jgi:hypothetical protein